MPCCGCCCAKVGGECCGPEDDRNCCKPDEGICCGPDGETQVCCPPERDCCSVYTIGEGEEEVCCAESEYCCFGESNPTAGICCEDTEVCCPGDVASSCCSPNQYCCDGVCSDAPCCAGSCDDENPCDEGCYCCDGVCQDEPCGECASDDDCGAGWYMVCDCWDNPAGAGDPARFPIIGPFDTQAEADVYAGSCEALTPATCAYSTGVSMLINELCCTGPDGANSCVTYEPLTPLNQCPDGYSPAGDAPP